MPRDGHPRPGRAACLGVECAVFFRGKKCVCGRRKRGYLSNMTGGRRNEVYSFDSLSLDDDDDDDDDDE